MAALTLFSNTYVLLLALFGSSYLEGPSSTARVPFPYFFKSIYCEVFERIFVLKYDINSTIDSLFTY